MRCPTNTCNVPRNDFNHPLVMWLSPLLQAPHKSSTISIFPSSEPVPVQPPKIDPIKHKNNPSRRHCSSSFVCSYSSLSAPSLNLVYSRLRSHQLICTLPLPWLGSSLFTAQDFVLEWTQLHPTQPLTPAEHSSRHISPLPCVNIPVLSIGTVYLDSTGVSICSDIKHRPS